MKLGYHDQSGKFVPAGPGPQGEKYGYYNGTDDKGEEVWIPYEIGYYYMD